MPSGIWLPIQATSLTPLILANLIPIQFANRWAEMHPLPSLLFVCSGSAVGPGPSCIGM